MRPHTGAEASDVLDCVEDWQHVFRAALGRRLVFADNTLRRTNSENFVACFATEVPQLMKFAEAATGR